MVLNMFYIGKDVSHRAEERRAMQRVDPSDKDFDRIESPTDVRTFEYFALVVYTIEVLMRFSATLVRKYFFVKGDRIQNMIDTAFVVIQMSDLIITQIGDGLPSTAMEIVMYLRVVRLIKVRDFIKVQVQETAESIRGRIKVRDFIKVQVQETAESIRGRMDRARGCAQESISVGLSGAFSRATAIGCISRAIGSISRAIACISRAIGCITQCPNKTPQVCAITWCSCFFRSCCCPSC